VSPPAAAAPARAARSNPARSVPRRPALRVVQPRSRRNGRILRLLAVAVVTAALLAVVVAHSVLAEGQVRLTTEQSQLAAEQAVHRQLLATVAQAENPSTIVAEAKNLGLVPPASVTQLPAVPLDTPLGPGTTTSSTTPTGTNSGSGTPSR
jgi:hypothetical protein